ncbi:nitroreductase family protein [Methylacidiphilum caldifontis]|uniref:Nitroreductase n=1 Tax=Methylacidiphilum caldifontis TaxID=2795386 RepID=A0A4Y8PBK9_9BACT|nr:nitroreductase family protein [Methylacidiphilum caldifontis]TFE68158.1 nitroreductase [Methylacidiphilum caldifontis]
MEKNIRLGDNIVFDYHQRTKHRLEAYAPSPMFLDWENEPFPFRIYEGSPKIGLALIKESGSSYFGSLGTEEIPTKPLDEQTLSLFLLDSLSISAWKRAPGLSPWSLRINPSSGNLHPTEVYLIIDSLGKEQNETALYHYCPLFHCLEKRATLGKNLLADFGLPAQGFFVGISSIYWRESWKYGERAYRYCQLDIGHVLGTIRFSASLLGWESYLVEGIGTELLGSILGLASQEGPEKEYPEILLLIVPLQKKSVELTIEEEKLKRLIPRTLFGHPNSLSKEHFPWPEIEKIAAVCQRTSFFPLKIKLAKTISPSHSSLTSSLVRQVYAREIIHQRRSAQAMDKSAQCPRDKFQFLLQKTYNNLKNKLFPFDLFKENFIIALLFFINHVEGLAQGIYFLELQSDLEEIKQSFHGSFLWEKIFDSIPFFSMQPLKTDTLAKMVHCYQSIAADGFFSLGMIVKFEDPIKTYGPTLYPELFWQCGLLGQFLYLEAEAVGFRATGIGCFFDDEVHRIVGIKDQRWQSLYHFTVGKEIVDKRIQKIDPYFFLEKIRSESNFFEKLSLG